jgi:microsomal epoxide hydrolase
MQVPFACALFPMEPFANAPRQWVEASYNLVQYTVMPRGGHFAAMEEPQLLVEDVRKFFAGLRERR